MKDRKEKIRTPKRLVLPDGRGPNESCARWLQGPYLQSAPSTCLYSPRSGPDLLDTGLSFSLIISVLAQISEDKMVFELREDSESKQPTLLFLGL